MSEELDINGLLESLSRYQLSPIERVIAGHTGTVQWLLSLWFGEAVVVRSRGQDEDADRIERQVDLVLLRRDLVVCEARSCISLAAADPAVIDRVRAQRLGIGQIAVELGIPTRRSIRSIAVTPEHIEREYEMRGPGLHFEVRERFPRARLSA